MTAALSSLGYDVDYLLDANLNQMQTAVINLKRKLSASGNSFGVFYYAGHGVETNGENYLIPSNADIPSRNMLPDRALKLQFVLDEMSDANNVLNVVILDACRNLPAELTRGGNRGLVAVKRLPAGSFIAYATELGKTAEDNPGERNGLFTGQLLKHIKTPGLELNELFRRTGVSVQQITNNKQIPGRYTQFNGLASLDGTRPNNIPAPAPSPHPVPPQPSNPFVGSWCATVDSNGATLTCILSFLPDGTIKVEQYDTNTITRKTIIGLYEWYTSDVKKGSGSGTYKFWDNNGNNFTIDIRLNIYGVSANFSRINAKASFSKTSPNEFTVSYGDGMQCEYLWGFRDRYDTFYKR
jgi:hypothetical protein